MRCGQMRCQFSGASKARPGGFARSATAEYRAAFEPCIGIIGIVANGLVASKNGIAVPVLVAIMDCKAGQCCGVTRFEFERTPEQYLRALEVAPSRACERNQCVIIGIACSSVKFGLRQCRCGFELLIAHRPTWNGTVSNVKLPQGLKQKGRTSLPAPFNCKFVKLIRRSALLLHRSGGPARRKSTDRCCRC